ncbi:MYND-type domain-containing protein [Pycnococcus provasolii]
MAAMQEGPAASSEKEEEEEEEEDYVGYGTSDDLEASSSDTSSYLSDGRGYVTDSEDESGDEGESDEGEEDSDGDDENSSEDSYYTDEEGDRDELPFPRDVGYALKNAGALRKQGKPVPPPSADTLKSLTEYFSNERCEPLMYGGYMELLQKLGGTPSSKDPLVKKEEANFAFMFRRDEDEERIKKVEDERVKMHMVDIRMLRYREWMALQKERGLDARAVWLERNEDTDRYFVTMSGEERNDWKIEGWTTKMVRDSRDEGLSQEQLVAFAKTWMEFYHHVNHDRVYYGRSEHGGQRVGDVHTAQHGDVKLISMQFSEIEIKNQAIEIRKRYEEENTPLPPPRQPLRPSSGGNRRNRRNAAPQSSNKDALVKTAQYATKVLLMMLDQLSDAEGVANINMHIFGALKAGIQVDRNLARAIADTKTLSAIKKIRSVNLEYAFAAEADLTRWPAVSLRQLAVCYNIDEVLSTCIEVLSKTTLSSTSIYEEPEPTPDLKLATRLYKACLDDWIGGIKSDRSLVRIFSIMAVQHSMKCLPRDFAIAFVKDKPTFATLLEACEKGFGDAKNEGDDSDATVKMCERARRRNERHEEEARVRATSFLTFLSARGMEVNMDASLDTPVVPGPLAHLMVKRGGLKMMLKLGSSSDALVARQATEGLCQLTRVRDCRVMLMQNDGVNYIEKALLSNDPYVVSNTMLSCNHLLWDSEWREPLHSLSPPIEETAMRLMWFAVHVIVEKTAKAKRKWTKSKFRGASKPGELMSLIKAKHAGEEGADEALAEYKRRGDAYKNRPSVRWWEAEDKKICTIVPWPLLMAPGRTMMVLATVHRGSKEMLNRTLKCGVMYAASCLLDVPCEDTFTGAFNAIANVAASGGLACIGTDAFPDCDHVVHSVMWGIINTSMPSLTGGKQKQSPTQSDFVMMRCGAMLYHAPGFKAHFRKFNKENPGIEPNWFYKKFFEEGGLYGQYARIAERPTRDDDDVREGGNAGCRSMTGHLRACGFCAKLEPSRGEFRSCGQCRQVWYCGRECQKGHWKVHKKECSKMAAAK